MRKHHIKSAIRNYPKPQSSQNPTFVVEDVDREHRREGSAETWCRLTQIMDSSRCHSRSTSSDGALGTNTSPLTRGVVSVSPPPPKYTIQQWHVVLGDTLARADRTTIATNVAREIKEKFKKDYKGVKKCVWIPLAMKELRQRLPKEKFPLSQANPPLCKSDISLVLVRCTPKAMNTCSLAHLLTHLSRQSLLTCCTCYLSHNTKLRRSEVQLVIWQ